MNCLEFRRLALADPYDPALDAQAESCAKCAKFRNELIEMDSSIEKALNVEVPDDLAAGILLNQSLKESNDTRTWVRYSMAASFAAALVLGGYLLNSSQTHTPPDTPIAAVEPEVATEVVKTELVNSPEAQKAMEDKVKKAMMEHGLIGEGVNPFIAHAHHQPHDFYSSEHQPIGDEELERLMNKFQLTASIDDVVYAAICPFQGENAIHLVIRDTTQEQYTVMLLPDRSPSKMYTVKDEVWRGYVSPHPAGALAVLAETDDEIAVERLREIVDSMQSAIYLSADL
jgi:hypothetical protein